MGFKLTQEEIMKLLKSGEDHVQKFAALKVTKSYVKREFSPHELEIVEDIFRLLCQRADIFVRIILSESCKNCDNLPHDIALKLAKDVEEVATPMLEYSKVLSDEDLCEIIDEAVKAKSVAIAKRTSLTTRVMTKLFGTKDKSVNKALAKNKSVHNNPKLYDELLKNLADDKEALAELAANMHVPTAITEKIIQSTSDSIARAVKAKYDISPSPKVGQGKDISNEISTLLMISDGTSDRQIEKLVNYIDYNGKLTPSIIACSICLGKLNFFLYAAAKKSKTDKEVVAKIIKEKGELGVRSILRVIGIADKLIDGLSFILKLTYDKKSSEPNINTNMFCTWLTDKLEQIEIRGHMEYIQFFLTIAKKGRTT
jgi:uncharacterized protein (DUF2336 family)